MTETYEMVTKIERKTLNKASKMHSMRKAFLKNRQHGKAGVYILACKKNIPPPPL